jgi:hypothetical protein
MKSAAAVLLVACCVLAAGCAGTALRAGQAYQAPAGQKYKYEIVNKAQVPDEGMGIFQERLRSQLVGSGMLAGNDDPSARSVQITIGNYYMRHGATRALVGIMAGVDNMSSTIAVRDASAGKTLTSFDVESKNPTAWGTSRGMIEDHADKIVEFLKSGKP